MTEWAEVNIDKHFSHWAKRTDRFYPVNVTHNILPAGIYEADTDNDRKDFFTKLEFPSDSLAVLPGMPTQYILNQIQEFWRQEERFKKAGFLFKRGVLLYGPSGCGKTSIIHQLSEAIKERNGLVIYVSDIEATQSALLKLREVEPTRPLLTIFEDIEHLMSSEGSASETLSFLDGEKQISNVVHVATTNKPDILEDRLLRRPGRFDLVIGLNPPILEARFVYLRQLLGTSMPSEQIDRIAEETAGFGLAHLRELVVAISCLSLDYETTLRRLRGNMKDAIKMPKIGSKTNEGFTVGFVPEERE